MLPDLDAGATGAMTGGAYPDGIRTIVDAYAAGRREEAVAAFEHWLPLINYENRQAGILTAKALMKEGGVITCEAPRHPWPTMHPATRAGLIETAQRLDPMVLRWAARRYLPSGRQAMKITQIETIRLGEFPNIIWVRLHTDEGLVGLGETFMGAQAVDAALGAKAAMQSASTTPAPATGTCAARSTRTRPTGARAARRTV